MSQSSDRPQLRTRLHSVQTERERDGTCVVHIELHCAQGAPAAGEGRAHDLPIGRIRAGAEATLAALRQLVPAGIDLQLRGAKAVRAFDAQVVIVAVRTRSERGRHDLIGAVRAPEGDLSRGGALAVLDALNRFLAQDIGPGDLPIDDG